VVSRFDVNNPQAVQKHCIALQSIERTMRERLAPATFEVKALEELVQSFAASEGIKLGAINQLLRVAVTGKAIGFGTYETLALLGRERCLARIDRALTRG
jgi:glutamyl-tRNA synthetase